MEKRYTISDALNIVLLPDGNMSEFDDDDSDHESLQGSLDDHGKDMEDESHLTLGGLCAESDQTFDEDQQDNASSAEVQRKPQRDKKKNYIWEKIALCPQKITTDYVFSDPPQEVPSPYEYFKMFITDDIIKHIADETNLYAMQTDGKELGQTPNDIEQFIGILLFTGIYPCPSYRMYWENSSRFPAIADVMARNRFETLLRYAHYNNNEKMKERDHPDYDPLFKVRPLLDKLRNQLKIIEPEERQCIDEQMIPFKGRSSLKQYLKKKPRKWGFKVFTRSGVSGMMYDFEIYTGKKMNLAGDFGVSGNSVMRMVDSLPKERHFKVYFDNWFASVPLVEALKDEKKWVIATIQKNRLSGCVLDSDSKLKQEGRGSYDYKVDKKNGITIVKWYDNKPVHMISSYCSVGNMTSCRRWSRQKRKHIDVPMPEIVGEYNQHMGGVDLTDMFLALYRIAVKSKKWYSPIVHYCFNVAIVDGWILYKRHMIQHGKTKKQCMGLKDFQCQIACALTKASKKIQRKRGRPSNDSPAPPKRAKPQPAKPVSDVQYDGLDHWPVHTECKLRCKFCPKGWTRISCSKCGLPLCLNKNNNCFLKFHTR